MVTVVQYCEFSKKKFFLTELYTEMILNGKFCFMWILPQWKIKSRGWNLRMYVIHVLMPFSEIILKKKEFTLKKRMYVIKHKT